jgi:hypothetical protein
MKITKLIHDDQIATFLPQLDRITRRAEQLLKPIDKKPAGSSGFSEP